MAPHLRAKGGADQRLADLLMYWESRRFSKRERIAPEFYERMARDDLEVSDQRLCGSAIFCGHKWKFRLK